MELRTRTLGAYAWGFLEFALDEPLLELGKLALRSARGVLPDGTPFDCPARDPLPAPLEIPATLQDSLVILALPQASMKHVLTKALGAHDDVDFEVTDQRLSGGDVILLCSDGLTNMLPDRCILEIVATRGTDLEGACADLVAAGDAQGGHDNISVILVRYDS